MNTKQLTDKEEIVAKVAEILDQTKVSSATVVNAVRDALLILIKTLKSSLIV